MLDYKDASQKVKHSLFTTLFDPSTEIGMAFNVANDVSEAYSTALYTYFREEDSNYERDEVHDDDEGEEDDEEEEDDSEVEEVQKPQKKKKGEGKSEEKPECKQQ